MPRWSWQPRSESNCNIFVTICTSNAKHWKPIAKYDNLITAKMIKGRGEKMAKKKGKRDRLLKLDIKTRRKLVFFHRKCQYKTIKEIASLLNCTKRTVCNAIRYWREHPDDMPLDQLRDVETLRLTQICKAELRIETLYRLKDKFEKPYCEVSVKKSTGGMFEITTTTKTSKRRDTLIKDLMKDIESAEKNLSILLGVWVEKTENKHEMDLGTILNNMPDEEVPHEKT